MIEVWQELPPKFRLPDPEDLITLWRGDKLGKLATGMSCRLTDTDPEQVVLATARQGHDALNSLIDQHTSAAPDSPLISVASDIRLAQFFTGLRSKDETIYEVQVQAHRLLRDPENIGTPRWPQDSELFIIGNVQPDDITRIKTNSNDRDANELNFEKNGRSYIATFETDMKKIPKPTSPNPLGVWVAREDSQIA